MRISLLLLPVAGWCQMPRQVPRKYQKVEITVKEEKKKKVPLYQGTYLGVEIAGALSNALGSDIFNTEVQAQVNLWNKFWPTVEAGYGKADAYNEDTELSYKTSSPYFRVGLDYNVFHKKPELPGNLLVGLRYGFSSFNFDVHGADMTDPNYGNATTVPFDYQRLKTNASWLELVIGLKAKIYKGFCMGWSIRYKRQLSLTDHENARPWYIPGFGKDNSTSFNFTYNIIYNLPF